MRLRRSLELLVSASLLSGCSGLTFLESCRNHISVANRSDYNVSLAADGPPSSEFDTAATDWLKFEKPGCKPANGRRTAFGTTEYDVTCESAQANR
jgi:hypothetical protein